MNQSQATRRTFPEAPYIPLARRILTAQRLENKAKEDKLQGKRECATMMHAVNVLEFDFEAENKRYHAKLGRRWGEQINVRKLYTLLGNGEITLDEFFDCIEAPIQAVEEALGDDVAATLKEPVKKGLDLVITEKKGR